MFLAWKELKHNKMRYTLITMILILIIFLVLFLAGLVKGLSAATSATIETAEANYYILDDSSDNLIPRSTLTEEQFNQVKSFTNQVTSINLQRATIKKDLIETKIDITYLGINSDSFMMPKVVEGNSLNKSNEIVLNLSFQEDGFAIGDKVIDSTSGIEMTVVGFTKNQMYGHSSIGVISLDTYKQIQSVSTGTEEIPYQGFAISLKETDKNKEQLQNFLTLNMKDVSLLTKSQIISNIPGHSQEQATILMILGFLLVISSFIVGVFFYVTTMQKISQFGVLKALGAKMSTLAWALLCQIFILSGISVIIGNILTFGMASVLPSSMPFILNNRDAVLVSLLFVIISLISSFFSMTKVARVDALSAIGGNE